MAAPPRWGRGRGRENFSRAVGFLSSGKPLWHLPKVSERLSGFST